MNRKFKALIVAQLRRVSLWWPAKQEAKTRARVGRGQYRCASCTDIFGPGDIDMDHINPVVDIHEIHSWDSYISNLFCPPEGYQALCKPCHKIKTQNENAQRRRRPKQ